MRWFLPIALLLMSLCAPVARAGEFGDPNAEDAAELVHGISLSYAAPESCPDAPAFESILSDRDPRLVSAGLHDAEGLTYRVTLKASDSTSATSVYTGRLETEVDGAPFVRELTSAHCDEVARALAVALSLQHEMQAERRPRKPTTRVRKPRPARHTQRPVAPRATE